MKNNNTLAIVLVVIGVGCVGFFAIAATAAVIFFSLKPLAHQGNPPVGLSPAKPPLAVAPQKSATSVRLIMPSELTQQTAKTIEPAFKKVEQTGASSTTYERRPVETSLTTPPTRLELQDEPAWDVELDQPRLTYDVTPDTQFRLPTPAHSLFHNMRPIMPVMAGLGGPFVVIPSDWKTITYTDAKPGDASEVDFTATPEEPVKIIDLRTGKTAGYFRWDAPLWGHPVLSPNGYFLVGPYRVPLFSKRRDTEAEKSALAALYVWKRDSTDEPTRLPMAGSVLWYNFVNRDEIGVLVGDQANSQAAQLQFWNVVTGRQRAAIDVPYSVNRFGMEALDIQRRRHLDTIAISPRGKYLAVADKDALALISVADAKLVGTINVSNLFFGTCGFSDDSSALFGIAKSPANGSWSCVLKFDAKSGRPTNSAVLEGTPLIDEPIWMSKDGFILAGRAPPYFAKPDQTYFAAFTDIFQILRIWDVGPVAVVKGKGNGPFTFEFMARSEFEALVDRSVPSPYGTTGPPKLVSLSESQAKVVDASGLDHWVPFSNDLPVMPKLDGLALAPWLVRTNQQSKAGLVIDQKNGWIQGSQGVLHQIKFSLIDQSGRPVGSQLAVRQLRTPENYDLKRKIVFDISSDGTKFLLTDPEREGRVEVISADGSDRIALEPLGEKTVVEWAGFTSEDHLVASGGGELVVVQMGPSEAEVVFRTRDAHYGPPFLLSRDRRHMFVSRGRSVDVMDLGAGRVINRVATSAAGSVSALACSPDGKRLAMAYGQPGANFWLFDSADMQYVQGESGRIVVWDLDTGEGIAADAHVDGSSSLAWSTNEHLYAIGNSQTSLLDLRLNALTMRFPGITSSNNDILTATPNGQVWRTTASHIHDNAWAPVSDALDGPHFAADRKVVSSDDVTIALDVDLGDAKLGAERGSVLIDELQKRSFAIGSGGITLQVHAAVEDGRKLVEVAQEDGSSRPFVLPSAVSLRWELHDPQGKVFWSTSTRGVFAERKSVYFKQAGYSVHYDFGGQDPATAMRSEICKALTQSLPTDFPACIITGNGRYGAVPLISSLDPALQAAAQSALGDKN